MTTYAYLRVSSKKNGKGKSKQSTDPQRTSIATFCKAHQIRKPMWVEDYISGRSYAESKRDGWNRIMTEAQAGDQVLCWKLDRTGRSAISSIRNILVLLERRVSLTITSTGMRFDGTDAMSVFLVQLFSALAELESNHISERVKMSIEHRRSLGHHVGRKPKQRQRSQIQKWLDKGIGVSEIARRLKRTRQAVYSMIERMDEAGFATTHDE